MIISVIFIFLFVLLISLLHYFIFFILLPALHVQSIIDSTKIFCSEEVPHYQNNDDCIVGKKKAVVQCSVQRSFPSLRMNYESSRSCKLYDSIYGSGVDCTTGCIGFGDCVKECPQHAIIIKNNTAVVTTSCIGCGLCTAVCPKHLIALFPADKSVIDSCNADSAMVTSCTECRKPINIAPPVKKTFKFWQSCYKIFFRS